jgi:threonine synthase
MGLRHLTGLSCLRCGDELPAQAGECPACAAEGLLCSEFDYDEAARSLDRSSLERREPWMWRYKELLPFDELAQLPSLQVGMTPVHGAPRLATWAGVAGLWLKDEGRNPTGSIADRASALAVVQARESGKKVLAAASAGSGLASLACFAASVDLRAVLFAPREAHAADLAQAARFGALVLKVPQGLAAARELCRSSCRALGFFEASAASSTAPVEGAKTVGLEIGEQLSERIPDWVVTSVGDGAALLGLARGLEAMRRLGLVKSVPRLLAAHSEGVTAPAHVERALRESRGGLIAVASAPAREAAVETARRAAVDSGPEAGLAVAGLRQAVRVGMIDAAQTVLAVVNARCSHPIEESESIVVLRKGEALEVQREARVNGLIR